MSNTTIKGVIEKILPVETFTKFQKQTVIVNNGEKYNPSIPCTFTQNHVDDIPAYNVGDTVEVTGSLEGREYNGKYYLDFRCFKIVPVGGSSRPAKQPEPPMTVAQINGGASLPEDDFDGLPF